VLSLAHVRVGPLKKPPARRVIMVGTGCVASAGTHIYLAVPREDRYALPNTPGAHGSAGLPGRRARARRGTLTGERVAAAPCY
jgi:hypothetical protein